MSDCGNEGDGGKIVDGEPVVSSCNTPPVFEATEHALDDIATAIGRAVERIDDVAGSATRDNRLDMSVLEPGAQFIGIVGFVGDQPPGWWKGVQQRDRHGDISDVACRQDDADDPATSIGQTMDFRCSAAARDTDRLRILPPFPPAAER